MSQCCEVLTMPRGGETGPPGIPGESGIQGIQGIQGANGLDGQAPVNQPRKLVKEYFKGTGNPSFNINITSTQLTSALSPGCSVCLRNGWLKINVARRSASSSNWALSRPAGNGVQSITQDTWGDIHISVFDAVGNAYYRVTIEG